MSPTITPSYSADRVHRLTRGMPGRQRNVAALRALRRERAARRVPPTTTLQERHHARIIARFSREIRSRGGETTINGKSSHVNLAVADRHDGMTLLRVEGWRYYGSRHPQRYIAIAYLCGSDDAGDWAVRVAGTCRTVRAALEEITPKAVRDAQCAGRRVRRQGDVWAVETTSQHDETGRDRVIAGSHEWRTATRRLVHRPADGRRHRPLSVPFPARFVVAAGRGMGRDGARRVDAD